MKLTSLERRWVLYDVANSAFTMMVSTIIPIYFKNLTAADGIADYDSTAWWSYATAITTLISAVLAPILGNIADKRRKKRELYGIFVLWGAVACVGLGFVPGWLSFLLLFIAAKTLYATSMVFYDAMLPDISSDDRMDVVSASGYAWGYIGSCIPFVLCLALILTADVSGIGTGTAMTLAFTITALWWFLLAVPLHRSYRQPIGRSQENEGLREILTVLKEIAGQKKIALYLLAYFFYIDGVYTIIEMATSYGKDVGISDNNLLLALLLTQIVAFPFALLFGRLTKRFETTFLLQVCIIAYFLIVLYALQLDKAWEFWLLAVCVGIFQGAIQSLSRSYFARIIPQERSGAYFGFYDIFGKGASFFGAALLGVATQLFSTSKAGVVAIALLFPLGFFFLRKSLKSK